MKYLKYGVGLVILLLLFRAVDFSALYDAIMFISLFDVLLLFALSYLLIAVSVLKWSAFLSHRGITESFHKLRGLYLIGYFVNLLMPSYIGGDVVRALKVGDENTDREAALSATMLERYTGLAAMLLLATGCVLLAPSVTPQIRLITYLIVVGFVCGSILGLLGLSSRIASSVSLLKSAAPLLCRLEAGMRLGLSYPPLLLKAAVLSLLFHCLTIVNTVAVAEAVGWDSPPLLDLFVVVPLILLVGAIPLSPQGLGVQEGAFFYFLHSVGASEGQALAIGLVLRAKAYVLALLGGIVWLWGRRRTSEKSAG